MQYNPIYPTSYPYGWFQLFEWSPASPTYIWGNMYNLPPPSSSEHAISINEWGWDGKMCASAGPHFQFPGQVHGPMNAPWSHQGSLEPLQSIGSSASYYQAAIKPSLWGVNNIYGKAMVVYENGDD